MLGFEGTEEKSNFDPIITPIKAKNPDLIYFGGIYDQAAPFFKQAREKGVKSKFMGPDGMDSSDLTKIAGKAVRRHELHLGGRPGVGATARPRASSTSSRRSSARTPSRTRREAYDATAIALKAIEAAAKGGKVPTREDVSAAVRKVKHTGITGDDRVRRQGRSARRPSTSCCRSRATTPRSGATTR